MQTVSLNLEVLLGVVGDYFCSTARYGKHDPKWYQLSESEQRSRHESYYKDYAKLQILCEAFNLDIDKLFCLYRSYYKWSEKTKWEKCLDVSNENGAYDRYIKYILRNKDESDHLEETHRLVVSWLEHSRKNRQK